MFSFSLAPPNFPVLYSFRRCPYAMRARLAIYAAEQSVELREIILKNKPSELLQASPKATVPVLVLPDGSVIDESRDIMLWALSQYKSQSQDKLAHDWFVNDNNSYNEAISLIDQNDFEFKANLDAYKYADRYPESADHYRQQGESFLQLLEQRLTQHRYLMNDQISLADMAIFPFIRQFAHVNIHWFNQSSYTQLQQWLNGLLASDIFAGVMRKYPAWQSGDAAYIFPE